MKADRADWAATAPYSGIQDFPALLARIAEDGIQISDVDGLAAALAAGGGGGSVAWSAITGKPAFGSAAFSPTTAFATSAQGSTADSAIQSVLGTANEITSTPGAGPSATLSLPAALTFTGKTVTGGNFDGMTRLGGSVQALSGAGAINLTDLCTDFTSTGATDALTLADGALGQFKTITHVADGGSGILTPTSPCGFATITFAAVGDSVILRFTAAGWAIVGSRGVVIA